MKFFEQKEQYTMSDLVKIMEILRRPDGCPWDRAQTHESIRHNFIEETYEAVEAIDLKDTGLLREELGDVLLQVVFHSQIESEKGSFTFDDVCDGICKKLIYRHPHVFGEETADSATGALENWEKMKNREKGRSTAAARLDSVPRSLPALMRSDKAQKRAGAYGFRPESAQSALDCISRSVDRLKADEENREQAVGRLLTAAVAAARALGVEPEEALNRATEAFCERVKGCEQDAAKDGLLLENLDPEQRKAYWDAQA